MSARLGDLLSLLAESPPDDVAAGEIGEATLDLARQQAANLLEVQLDAADLVDRGDQRHALISGSMLRVTPLFIFVQRWGAPRTLRARAREDLVAFFEALATRFRQSATDPPAGVNAEEFTAQMNQIADGYAEHANNARTLDIEDGTESALRARLPNLRSPATQRLKGP